MKVRITKRSGGQSRAAKLKESLLTSNNMSNPPELKIKGLDRKLKQSEIDFMKLIEEQNLQRVLKLKKTRKLNIITGNNTKF